MLLQLNYNKRVRLKSKLRAISEHSNEQVQVRNCQTFQYSMFIKVNVLCTDLQLQVRVSWKNHIFFFTEQLARIANDVQRSST